MRVLALLCTSFAAACVGGPDACFRPPSIVDTSRVLGVRADPPDQFVDLAGTSTPHIHARALFAGQGDRTPVQLGGFLCAPTDDLRCPSGSFVVPSGTPSLTAEAETAFDVPLSLIAAARDADPLGGYGGIRVQYDSIGYIGPRQVHVAKVLLFQTDPSVRPNGAIELGPIELSDTGDPTQFGSPGSSTKLHAGVSTTYDVRPRVLPGAGATEAAEEYTVTDLTGHVVTLRETISYSFFTTQELIFGDLERIAGNPRPVYVPGADVADEPAPGSPDPANGLVRLTALQEAATHLWVVARDGRGAVAWNYAQLEVNDTRACGDRCSSLQIVCLADQSDVGN
ncbi:MAG: hypothetical protein JST92_20170 [Deltaproteobacteria bacterium]|nr:hypothetical protein [Deltaproteobacteria bacterium]